jgi:hypothetical protein
LPGGIKYGCFFEPGVIIAEDDKNPWICSTKLLAKMSQLGNKNVIYEIMLPARRRCRRTAFGRQEITAHKYCPRRFTGDQVVQLAVALNVPVKV